MNTPVNFEIAMLLKEKGFDTIDCGGYYHICNGYTKGYTHCYSDVNTQEENAILAPTIAEVVMWLYEKYEVWIVVNFANKNQWYFDCNKVGFDGKDKKLFQSNYDFTSPTEAYEAAVKYTLENLI